MRMNNGDSNRKRKNNNDHDNRINTINKSSSIFPNIKINEENHDILSKIHPNIDTIPNNLY